MPFYAIRPHDGFIYQSAVWKTNNGIDHIQCDQDKGEWRLAKWHSFFFKTKEILAIKTFRNRTWYNLRYWLRSAPVGKDYKKTQQMYSNNLLYFLLWQYRHRTARLSAKTKWWRNCILSKTISQRNRINKIIKSFAKRRRKTKRTQNKTLRIIKQPRVKQYLKVIINWLAKSDG